MSTRIVTHGGRRFSEQMLAAVLEVARLCQQGKNGFTPRITQGGHNSGAVSASAGTHDGDAVDWSVRGLSQSQVATLVSSARKVGIAAWFRTTSVPKWGTRAHGFGSYHVHGVPNRWGYPSAGAANQATAYRNGRDGLKRNLEDLGPGHTSAYRTRTWAEYKRLTQITPPKTGAPGGLTMSDIKTITEKLDRIENALLAKRRAGGKDHSVIDMIVADHVIQMPQSVALADLQARMREVQSRVGSNPDQRAFVAAIVEGIAPLIGESAQEAATTDPDAIAEATVTRLLAKIATLS